MSFRDCEHVWRRGWLCTISASGLMSNSVAPGWPLLSCSDGDLITHTKRLSLTRIRGLVLIQASLVKGPHESVATYFTVKSSIRSADDPGSSTFFLPRLGESVAAGRHMHTSRTPCCLLALCLYS
jgi:hypothetical protein